MPVLVIDIKGDLPNLLLRFPELSAEKLVPWVEGNAPPSDTRSAHERAAALAETHQKGRMGWDITENALKSYAELWAALDAQPDASAAEVARLVGCAYETTRSVAEDFRTARAAAALVGSAAYGSARVESSDTLLDFVK